MYVFLSTLVALVVGVIFFPSARLIVLPVAVVFGLWAAWAKWRKNKNR
jgi:hypothetical protein